MRTLIYNVTQWSTENRRGHESFHRRQGVQVGNHIAGVRIYLQGKSSSISKMNLSNTKSLSLGRTKHTLCPLRIPQDASVKCFGQEGYGGDRNQSKGIAQTVRVQETMIARTAGPVLYTHLFMFLSFRAIWLLISGRMLDRGIDQNAGLSRLTQERERIGNASRVSTELFRQFISTHHQSHS